MYWFAAKNAALLLACMAGFLPVLLVSPASAALIDIVVIGTWERTDPPLPPTANTLGLNIGDRFVMKGTYDDTTLFNGSEGVTATVDPSVNPGTSFDVIIPHAAGAPNPLEFDHTDHTSIGFGAPHAQIEFDGTDATTDPGTFRNFEIHVDFPFGGDQMDLDLLFMGGIQPESALLNETRGFRVFAEGDGGPNDRTPHLEVVTNDVTANAGGPYVFDAANLSVLLNGSSGGGNAFGKTFAWSGPGGRLANSPGQSIAFALAESGLTNTTDASSVDLVVTENFTDFAAGDSASVSYANAAPVVLSASGTTEADNSITFAATFDDEDLVANALVVGFEEDLLEFLFADSVFLTGEGNVDLATLLGIFGGLGTFEVEARVTDLAGASDSQFFDVEVVPEPGTFALLSVGLSSLARARRHRAAGGSREGSGRAQAPDGKIVRRSAAVHVPLAPSRA